jgi:hypothetical protein
MEVCQSDVSITFIVLVELRDIIFLFGLFDVEVVFGIVSREHYVYVLGISGWKGMRRQGY